MFLKVDHVLVVFCLFSQEYAQVTRMLGQGRLEAYCFDDVTRLCHIRGKMRKKVWVTAGDIILVGLREFQVQIGISCSFFCFRIYYVVI